MSERILTLPQISALFGNSPQFLKKKENAPRIIEMIGKDGCTKEQLIQVLQEADQVGLSKIEDDYEHSNRRRRSKTRSELCMPHVDTNRDQWLVPLLAASPGSKLIDLVGASGVSEKVIRASIKSGELAAMKLNPWCTGGGNDCVGIGPLLDRWWVKYTDGRPNPWALKERPQLELVTPIHVIDGTLIEVLHVTLAKIIKRGEINTPILLLDSEQMLQEVKGLFRLLDQWKKDDSDRFRR